MTPPDSDAREVLCDCGSDTDVHRIECATVAWLHTPPTGPFPPLPPEFQTVSLPLSLAQRILAALEGGDANRWRAMDTREALAAELRAVIGK